MKLQLVRTSGKTAGFNLIAETEAERSALNELTHECEMSSQQGDMMVFESSDDNGRETAELRFLKYKLHASSPEGLED